MSTAPSFVAITPAHNEADRIGALVRSMAEQTLLPTKWVVVDDASEDDTAATVEAIAAEVGLDIVSVVRRSRSAGRSFSSKADAVNHGWATLQRDSAQQDLAEPDYIACIDADVVLPDNYFAVVAEAFAADPLLGVTGGVYMHPVGDQMVVDRPPAHHVPGPTQAFRRQAWNEIGGYWRLPHGGVDTAANVAARMSGWSTRCLPDMVVDHSRRMGTGGGRHPVVAEFHKGLQDHDLGAHPLFEVGKVARRLVQPPYVIGALSRFAGYVRAALKRNRPVGNDFVAFAQREQLDRIRRRLPGGKR